MIVVAALLTACTGAAVPAPGHPGAEATSTAIMSPPSPSIRLSGLLRVAPRANCGGAYLPRHPQPELAPAGDTHLLVRSGDANSETTPVAELTTRPDGSFEAMLAPGRYCIVFATKRDVPTPGGPNVDPDCLAREWQRCDAVADLPATTAIHIDHYTPCFRPCYQGPRPQ